MLSHKLVNIIVKVIRFQILPSIDKHVYKAIWKENRALDQKSSEKFIPFIREHFTVNSSDFCKNCMVLAHVTVNYLGND